MVSSLYRFYLSLRQGKLVNNELSDVPEMGSSQILHPSYIYNLTVNETGFFATNLTITYSYFLLMPILDPQGQNNMMSGINSSSSKLYILCFISIVSYPSLIILNIPTDYTCNGTTGSISYLLSNNNIGYWPFPSTFIYAYCTQSPFSQL